MDSPIILYTQEDCVGTGEQFASYYYKVVGAFHDAEVGGARVVAPVFPFAPRNNRALEADPTQSVAAHIQARYKVDVRIFLDLSASFVCDFDEFLAESKGRVNSEFFDEGTQVYFNPVHRVFQDAESAETIPLTIDKSSKYVVKPMNERWDYGKKIGHIFNATVKYPFKMEVPNYLPSEEYIKFYRQSKNFLAVHWKRGDNLAADHGATADDHSLRTDADRVGDSINYLLSVNRKAHDEDPTVPLCTGVFIATDTTVKKDRDRVITIIRKENKGITVFITPDLSAVEPEKRWAWDGADLWLGSQASALFLSPYVLEDCSCFGRLMVANARRRIAKLSVTFM
jgi:hypothetical protein